MTIVLTWAFLKWICLGSLFASVIGFTASRGSIEGGFYGFAWTVTKMCLVVFLISFLVIIVRGFFI